MADEKRGVQSIEVGGRLLECMAATAQPLMLREIAAGAQVTPAQAHAYLVSFRKIGLVEQVTASGRYQLGPFALQLGLARLRSIDALRLAEREVVDFAATIGLMVTLTVWGSFGATVVHVQEGADPVHVSVRAGTVYAVRSTATGLVFAAFLPEPLVAAHLKSESADRTKGRRVGYRAVTEPLPNRIAEIRRDGLAVALGSPIPGVNAISAPVFDHTGQLQLAVTLIGAAETVDVAPNSEEAAALLAFTGGLSRDLGFDPIAGASDAHGKKPATASRQIAAR